LYEKAMKEYARGGAGERNLVYVGARGRFSEVARFVGNFSGDFFGRESKGKGGVKAYTPWCKLQRGSGMEAEELVVVSWRA
jgi:hypothetical protein